MGSKGNIEDPGLSLSLGFKDKFQIVRLEPSEKPVVFFILFIFIYLFLFSFSRSGLTL